MSTQANTIETVHARMLSAITAYDAKQSKRKGYNPYGGAIMLRAMQSALDEMREGTDTRKAILAHFNGRLCDAILRACGLSEQTSTER